MAEPTETTNPNPAAPEGQAPASAAVQPNATPAPAAGEDANALKAQLDSLLKWKAEAEADLKKGRDARKAAEEKAAADKVEAEKQLREAGKFAELAKVKEDEANALRAQIAEFTGKASQLDSITKTMGEKIAAAKAKGDLPSFIVKAIDAAPNPVTALDILDDYRAAQAQAPKGNTPAPPAPQQGAAPATPAAPINMANPSVADLQTLKAKDPGAFRRLIFGQGPSTEDQSVQARLAGAGRK